MPLTPKLEARLAEFCAAHPVRSKGVLALVLHVSRLARTKGLPLSWKALVTGGKGQVLGLSKDSVQRVLAEEGGRTSRSSMGMMQSYVKFLNQDPSADTAAIETWWIERVREHFAAKPLRLRYDAAKGLQAIIRDLLAQAKKRQQESSGAMYQGAVLQHLVGAKLELAMPELTITHNGFSVADAVSDRSGDFVQGDTIIHVTTFPAEALLRKCRRNLEAGAKPLILTLGDGVTVARGLAEQAGLLGRIDIMDAEQFIARNLHELSGFKVSKRKLTLERLVTAYNAIVSAQETDPSLRIEVG